MSTEMLPAGAAENANAGARSESMTMSGFFPPELILAQLSSVRATQPVAALASANQHREILTEAFLQAIERGLADPGQDLTVEGMLFNYATYFLAKWREPRAFPLFLRWMSLPGEAALDLGGDTLPQDGARFLASVCAGQVEPLKALIQNREANEICRGQALTALGVLVAWNEWPRAELEGFLLFLAREGLDRQFNQVWRDLAAVALHLELLPAFPELRRACAEGVLPESFIGVADIEQVEQAPRGGFISQFTERYHPIDDVVKETRWWAGFQQPGAGGSGHPAPGVFGEPYVAPPKVGRNDLCPCGSGKKFKKCCGH